MLRTPVPKDPVFVCFGERGEVIPKADSAVVGVLPRDEGEGSRGQRALVFGCKLRH
ncbi:hypothetical protein KKI24_30225 [bacterium]|nr:hypothetical protein [bacterium]